MLEGSLKKHWLKNVRKEISAGVTAPIWVLEWSLKYSQSDPFWNFRGSLKNRLQLNLKYQNWLQVFVANSFLTSTSGPEAFWTFLKKYCLWSNIIFSVKNEQLCEKYRFLLYFHILSIFASHITKSHNWIWIGRVRKASQIFLPKNKSLF